MARAALPWRPPPGEVVTEQQRAWWVSGEAGERLTAKQELLALARTLVSEKDNHVLMKTDTERYAGHAL